MKMVELPPMKVYPITLTLLHSERPKLYAIWVFLSAIGKVCNFGLSECNMVKYAILAFLSAIGLSKQFWPF